MTSGNPRLRTSSASVGTPNFGHEHVRVPVEPPHRREVEVIEVVVREVHVVGLEHLGRGIGDRRVVPPRPPVARSEQPGVDQDRRSAGLDAQAAVPDDGELHQAPGRPRRAIAAAASTSSVPRAVASHVYRAACVRAASLMRVRRSVVAQDPVEARRAARRRRDRGCRSRRRPPRRRGRRRRSPPAGVPHAAASVMVIPHPSRADALARAPRPAGRGRPSSSSSTRPGRLIHDSARAAWICASRSSRGVALADDHRFERGMVGLQRDQRVDEHVELLHRHQATDGDDERGRRLRAPGHVVRVDARARRRSPDRR